MNTHLRERVMSDIVYVVLVDELLVDHPWSIRYNLVNPPLEFSSGNQNSQRESPSVPVAVASLEP